MATLSNVLTFSRTQAQTDSIGLTNTNGIIFANEALLDFRRRLISAGVDASQIQESYRDGAGGTGTYLYPTDMFWLKAIECNYVNTNEQDYKTAQQIDVSNLAGGMSFSWYRKNADRNSPQFDDRGDWFEIFPTPQSSDNVSQLIRIFYYLEPTEYTSVTDTITYPESLDYRVLGWRIAANYYYSIGKMQEGDRFGLKYEERVLQLIATLSRGSQQPIQSTTIQLTGFEY
jgi:hypothetical protein